MQNPPITVINLHSFPYRAIMAEEDVGAVLCMDGIADTSTASIICFRPFNPKLEVNMTLAWKKGVLFSPAAVAFHKELYRLMQS